MIVSSASRYLVPALLGVTATLAAANWYLEPAAARNSAAALLLLLGLAVVSWLARRSPSAPARQSKDAIRHSVAFAALMLLVSLSARLAYATGLINDTALSQRMTMVVVGAYLVVTGNSLPKMLTPLSSLQCNAAKVQALRRFAGWTQVLTGLSYAAAWLIFPPVIAKPLSIAFVLGGSLIVMARVTRLRRTRHREV